MNSIEINLRNRELCFKFRKGFGLLFMLTFEATPKLSSKNIVSWLKTLSFVLKGRLSLLILIEFAENFLFEIKTKTESK